MTFSLLTAQVLLKARQHKYTHRKLVGRDPKTNRKRYRYYYAEHHGGGITSAEIEAGSAFKLTFKGRRGHFHVQSVEGDVVTVKHDGRPNSKPVEMTKAEFRALLKRQHETVENKKREKAQENRRRGRKKRKGSKRTKRKTTPQTQAPEQTPQVQDPEQGADNFETMPETITSLQRKYDQEQEKLNDLEFDINAVKNAIKNPPPFTNYRSFKADPKDLAQHKEEVEKREIELRATLKKLENKYSQIDNVMRKLSMDIYNLDRENKTKERAPAREQLTETSREVETLEPTASELSDDDLRRELLRARAALDDQGTLIDEARRKRQRISDLRKKEKVLAERVNTLENESQRRTPEPQGRGAKVPSQSELDRAIEQVRALVEQNPALANRPEVAVLLGSPDKQEVVAKGLPDSEMVITLNGKTQNVAVKYKIIEAGDAIPSHDASAFFQRKDYPSDVQEREYHNARSGEQEKVILQAKNLNPLLLVNTNPDAMNGPPILDQNGIALGGNSRVMSVQRAYLAHPEKAQAYKDYLKKKASTFGLSQSDVEGFSSPLLVREYVVENQGKENLSKIVRAMNEGLTQEFDLLAEGRNNATKLLGENNTLRSLSVALRDAPDDTTLNTMLKTKGERFERVKRALFADGILTKRNASKYLSQATGTMNDVGVAMLKSTLLGYVVRDDRLMRAMSPTTVDTLTNAFGRLAVVGLDRDQAEALQDAVYVYNQVTNKSKDTGGITTKMTPKQRDARVNESMMRDQGFTFKEASGEDVADESINFEKIKDRVKDNPLSSAFLKILALNPTSGALNRSMKEFVKLVDEDQGGTDLFGSAAVDFTTAAKQIASKLANKHGARDGLYKSLIGLNLLDLYKALRC
tara:strand:- start:2963 stop:5563 length:2601 start_codon:yes stop_codon:yes gene_type:complete